MIVGLVIINSILALGTVVVLLYAVLRLTAYLNPGAYRRVVNTDKLFPNLKPPKPKESDDQNEKPSIDSELNKFLRQ